MLAIEYFLAGPPACSEGDIRLVEQEDIFGLQKRQLSESMSGRVEVCVEGEWRALCREHWDSRDAAVACRQLGFSPYGEHLACGQRTLW